MCIHTQRNEYIDAHRKINKHTYLHKHTQHT